MKNILTTQNLTKRYGKHNAAEKINIHIKKGEIYGLIGRNGAGKTTILRMISGLSIPTEGSYSINGKTGPQLAYEKKAIGTLIEAPGLYPNMNAYENLKIKCIATGKNNRKYIQELLTLVGLENTGHKKAKDFSLGMRQRLGIALALVGDPELIVLDEPINGLDPQGIAELREIFVRLSKEKGITIIISSHILDELSKVADSYGIIHEGKLIEEFTSEELNKRCGEFVILKTDDINKTAYVLMNMNITDFEKENNETIKIHSHTVNTAEIVNKLVSVGVNVNEIYYNRLTLEEYYLNLTGGTHNA